MVEMNGLKIYTKVRVSIIKNLQNVKISSKYLKISVKIKNKTYSFRDVCNSSQL